MASVREKTMQHISLSIFRNGRLDEQQKILMSSLLDAFEHEQHIHVELDVIPWQHAWPRLLEMAIYGRGPDLSEVGSTWVMDLVRMNALRSISPLEMMPIGSEKDFVQSNWQACTSSELIGEAPVIWGIPWSSDTRLLFYRRDLLEQANIDPATAFEHIDVFDRTIAALQADGQEYPLALSTLRSQTNIHYMASWIWDCGGQFIKPDGKHVAFDDPQALRGMRHYFGLGKYIPASYHRISDEDIDRLFYSGQAAVAFSGPWIIGNSGFTASAIRATLGLAPMPGASFVGGSHLVVWKHSQKKEAALALANFIVKHSGKYGIFPTFGLPAYLPEWSATQFLEEPYFSAFQQALQNGRSFPTSELWGLVEKRLTDVVPFIWEKVLDSNNQDIDEILAEMIIPLAKNLNNSLE
jgi:multiple sugar transport system substrate-binding protein